MFTKIKEFLFGKDPVQSPAAAPYKVEIVPAGTEASVAAPVTPNPQEPAKTQAPAKPKTKAPAPKAPAKPRAPAKPKTAKPVAK
jgi:translation initiation factor IF-3